MAKKKLPRGRPKLPRGQDRGKILTLRLRADERECIARAAKTAGKAVSEWCRDVLLDRAR